MIVVRCGCGQDQSIYGDLDDRALDHLREKGWRRHAVEPRAFEWTCPTCSPSRPDSDLDDHAECVLDCACGDDDCPAVEAQRRRAEDGAPRWSALELRNDHRGAGHYLDGEPVPVGAILELQGQEERQDDFGDYYVPTGAGAVVRYDAFLDAKRPHVYLYADAAGHKFEGRYEERMRFRWPRRH
jgi:hypothetical protein